MKRIVFIIALASLYACQPTPAVKDVRMDSVPALNQSPVPTTPQPSGDAIAQEDSPGEAIGIAGDFNGDGVIDSAWRELVKASTGADEPSYFAVRFNTTAIPAMENIEGRFRLINEGDLNGDGRPDISLFQSPLHGTVHYMTTWTLQPSGWKRIAGPWMIPTAGEYQTDAALQARIVLENDTVYYWQEDVNDENFTLQKAILQLEK